MGSELAKKDGRKRSSIALHILAHYEALRLAPMAYLTAWWWRLRRKRLRARGQFARLLASSGRAYKIWIHGHEENAPPMRNPEASPTILGLISARHCDMDLLNASLQSLTADGIPCLVVGEGQIPDPATAAQHIAWTTEPWLLVVNAGDIVAPGTAAHYRAKLAERPAKIVYADDDLLTSSGERSSPHFKPQWNSELFKHFDYLTGACIFRTSREELEALGDFRELKGLLARHAVDQAPLHVPKILHHRRARPLPPAKAKPLELVGHLPLVTVIVPTRNRVNLLRTCLQGLRDTSYPKIEVIIVDNDSDESETISYLASIDNSDFQVIQHAGEFNYSAINNRAALLAKGEIICLLNNDIEVIESDWLAILVTQALREDVGAVGARLLYPDGRIQHAGVVLGMGGAAGHAHKFAWPDEIGYFNRHNLPQFASAVTGACLVVKRDRFQAVGGLNENDFPVAFNDVDLCLRLNERGWQSLYEPRATLIHHESVSRGLDRDPISAKRFAKELAALKKLWNTDRIVDPYHHLELSRTTEKFVIRLEDYQ